MEKKTGNDGSMQFRQQPAPPLVAVQSANTDRTATGRSPERNLSKPESTTERLPYIDVLRGIAIFSVVMGHFLAWTFAPSADRGVYPVFVKNILYTFHLPLFFFLSGFVVELRRKTWNLKTWGAFMGKRSLALLVPGFTFMVFSFLSSGQWSFPWFLAALFEMLVLFSVPKLLSSRFGANWLVEMAIHGALWAGLACYVTMAGMGAWQQFISLKLMVVFQPFFLCGYCACRWNLSERIVRQRWMYTMALLLYVVVLYEKFAWGRFPESVTKYPLGLCAVVVFFRLAQGGHPDSGVGRMLGILGRNSLCIYLLSPFFIPWFPDLGNLFIVSDAYVPYGLAGLHHVSSVFLQLTTGILVSVYVCAACLLVKKVVSGSALLDCLLFGTRPRH